MLWVLIGINLQRKFFVNTPKRTVYRQDEFRDDVWSDYTVCSGQPVPVKTTIQKQMHWSDHRINPKYLDTLPSYHTCPEIWISPVFYLLNGLKLMDE